MAPPPPPSLGDWGLIGLRVNAVVRNVPVADHKRVQSNGLYPQHGGMMTSMHDKVYRDNFDVDNDGMILVMMMVIQLQWILVITRSFASGKIVIVKSN